VVSDGHPYRDPERGLRGQDQAGASAELSPSGKHNSGIGIKALNPRGVGTCVREDLMDLLIERNQLG